MSTRMIQRLSASSSRPAFVARVLAVAMVGACAGALAQTVIQPEVTVRGIGTVQKERVGRSLDQVPLDRVTLSRTVTCTAPTASTS